MTRSSIYENLKHDFRPWGVWHSLFKDDESYTKYQIKLITVKPGAKLSLQTHCHRSEHWIVLSGLANVQCNDADFILQPGQSTYIPARAKHRLENIGKIPLEVIEVQLGQYLGEDDINRLDDDFGRCNQTGTSKKYI